MESNFIIIAGSTSHLLQFSWSFHKTAKQANELLARLERAQKQNQSADITNDSEPFEDEEIIDEPTDGIYEPADT
jgi:hypothetical protein